jgi:hypothetical protein
MSRLRSALVVVFLTACGRSAAQQAAQAAQELHSWEATLRLAEAQQRRGAIPPGFAAQVRRAGAAGRTAAEAKLRKATRP